jgi:ribulose-phosphate 3-epimerase
MVPQTIRAIIHAEMHRPFAPMLEEIRALNLETGIALCPETSPSVLDHLPQLPDRVLVMGIHPGASGQAFLGESILATIRRLRALHPNFIIAVDGGITSELAPDIISAGANSLVASSAIWNSNRPAQAYEQLTHSTALPAKRRI